VLSASYAHVEPSRIRKSVPPANGPSSGSSLNTILETALSACVTYYSRQNRFTLFAGNALVFSHQFPDHGKPTATFPVTRCGQRFIDNTGIVEPVESEIGRCLQPHQIFAGSRKLRALLQQQ